MNWAYVTNLFSSRSADVRIKAVGLNEHEILFSTLVF